MASTSDAARGAAARAEARIAELDATITQRTSERDATREELARRAAELGETRDKLGDAEEKVAELTASLAARQGELEARGKELETALERGTRLESELGVERTRLEKARIKWGEDRQSLERARQALTDAISRLSEPEQRSID